MLRGCLGGVEGDGCDRVVVRQTLDDKLSIKRVTAN